MKKGKRVCDDIFSHECEVGFLALSGGKKNGTPQNARLGFIEEDQFLLPFE